MAATHALVPMMVRKQTSWTRNPDGARVMIQGDLTDKDEYLRARSCATHIKDAVLAAEPRARVIFNLTPTGCMVLGAVYADDLAVFANGSIHRKAIGRVRLALSRALETCGWLP